MLHNIAFIGPSPADRDPIPAGDAAITADAAGPIAALVFKTAADPYVGKLTYLRVFSGTVKSDSHLWNANKEADERIGQLYVQKGKDQEAIGELRAGDARQYAVSLISPMLLAVIWRETFVPIGADPLDIPALARQHVALWLRGMETAA